MTSDFTTGSRVELALRISVKVCLRRRRDYVGDLVSTAWILLAPYIHTLLERSRPRCRICFVGLFLIYVCVCMYVCVFIAGYECKCCECLFLIVCHCVCFSFSCVYVCVCFIAGYETAFEPVRALSNSDQAAHREPYRPGVLGKGPERQVRMRTGLADHIYDGVELCV